MKTWIPEERTGWIKDNNGWWYRRPDGSYPANAWHTINPVSYTHLTLPTNSRV